MQRHSGDTFGNRFRGVTLLFGLLALFSLVAAGFRGCVASQSNKPDEAQIKRVATRASIDEEQNKLLEGYGLTGPGAADKLASLLPEIAARKEAKSQIVVPGSPTQLKMMQEQAPPAEATDPSNPAAPDAPANEPTATPVPDKPVETPAPATESPTTPPAEPAPAPAPAVEAPAPETTPTPNS